MQRRDTFTSFRELRNVDIIGVLIVVAIAGVTVWEYQSKHHDITESLDSVKARTHRDHNDQICAIAINDTHIAQSDVVAQIAQLRSLEKLSLSRSTIDNSQLYRLPELRSLRSLSLYNTNLSNDGLSHVGECRALEVLSLDGTSVSSRGIANLTPMKNLQYLSLARTAVDDRCVSSLGALESLKEIDLRGTKMTDKGINNLQELLPDCQISFDSRTVNNRLHASNSPRFRRRPFARTPRVAL